MKKAKCQRCGYEWIPRTEEVTRCGNKYCRSPYWNKPKRAKK